MLKSLKFKFYASFLLLSLLSFFIIISSDFLSKEERKIEVVEQELNSIYINTLLTSNYMMDFIQNDSRNILFFETGNSKLIDRIKILNQSIDEKSKRIEKSLILNQLKLKYSFNLLQNEILIQRKNYAKLLSLIRKRGYTEYGYVGAMRNNIHQVESKLPQYNALILSIRRNEKDYMLRLDSNYIVKLNVEIDKLQTQIKQNSSTSSATEILGIINSYQKYFFKIVQINNIIGTNENEGIFKSLAYVNKDIQINFNSIAQSLSENKHVLEDRIHRLFLSVSFFIIILGIIFSVYLSNKTIRPILELTKHTHEFVKNKFKILKPLTTQSTITEIDTWIKNYNTLENEIVGLLEEFHKKVAERTEVIEVQNKELRELNNTKDKFFSIIAHDLKGPFISVYEFSSKLKSDFSKLPDEKKQKYIANIETISYQTFKLLENLLDWSRIQAGHIRVNKKSENLYVITQEVLAISATMASLKNISILNSIPESFEIKVDKELTQTIIRNLISNAIKFTPNNGQISISSKIAEDYTLVSIQDSGVGIPPDKIEKIFKIEENTSTRGTNAEKGTGLGLVLCKELVEKQGGEISITSMVNEGTTVCFTIPFSENL